jgi:hypothetical protein
MHATTDQVTAMWNRCDRELTTFDTELVVRRIVNKNDENRTRLTVYNEGLEGLRVWVGIPSSTFLLGKHSRDLTGLGYQTSTSGLESWMVHLCLTCMSNMENTITVDAVIW